MMPRELFTIHPSWSRLASHGADLGREEFQLYYNRVGPEFPNIPAEVLQQWIYLHHANEDMRELYGWIDYKKVEFRHLSWTGDQILQIKAFSRFTPYVKSSQQKVKLSSHKLSRIELRKEVIAHWTEYGTWKTPIVVFDTSKVSKAPVGVELNKPYQLIEGHTRLGWFYAFLSFSKEQDNLKLAPSHNIWLMNLC